MDWEEIDTVGVVNIGSMIGLLAGRCKVPGGWFVFLHHGGKEGSGFFYPDPTHKWDGNSLP